MNALRLLIYIRPNITVLSLIEPFAQNSNHNCCDLYRLTMYMLQKINIFVLSWIIIKGGHKYSDTETHFNPP